MGKGITWLTGRIASSNLQTSLNISGINVNAEPIDFEPSCALGSVVASCLIACKINLLVGNFSASQACRLPLNRGSENMANEPQPS